MGYFSHMGIVDSGHDALDRAISDLELVTTDSGTFLVSTSGAAGGIASYEIATDGATSLVDSHFFSGFQERLDSAQISIFDIDGAPHVVTGSIGSARLVGQPMAANGHLGGTTNFDGFSSASGAMSAMAEVSLSGGRFIFLAKSGGNKVDAYRITASASHLASSSVSDTTDSYAAGIVDMAQITVNSSTYLLTLSSSENGVSCFQVGSANGALTECGSFGAKQGLGIDAATDLEVVSAFGATFAIIASAGSSSLSVLKVSADGSLSRADHILDTLHTRFGGVTSVETIKINGQVYVIAGGADDGLSLFALLPGGRLQHLETIVNDGPNQLDNVQSLVATQVEQDIHIFVTSGSGSGISQFEIDLPNLGPNLVGSSDNDTLTGTGASEILSGRDGNDIISGGFGTDFIHDGAGSDTLTGGGGGDVFVLSADGVTDRILDYQPYYDWIDLSAYPMLYSHRQLEFTSTDTGAILSYRGETLVITHGGNKPLKLHQVLWNSFSGPSRPAWDIITRHNGTSGNDTLSGSYMVDLMFGLDGNDTLEGRAGSDTLEGGNGNDTLSGGDAGDILRGGAGDDTLNGNSGDDTLFGGDGSDILFGNDGNDTLSGGAGADFLDLGNGDDNADLGDGNDRAVGKGGDDRISGQAGNDRVSGKSGDDRLFGQGGNDTLKGNAGKDLLKGGAGDDTLDGGSGNDTLFGNGGDDHASGGKGADTIDLGKGNDIAKGSAGNDRILGGKGADNISGNSGNDYLHGGSGDDTLIGGSDQDTILGGSGKDRLNGGNGQDQLNGGKGADICDGGTQRDVLTGGDGQDTFVFRSGDGRDVVTDFKNGADKIHIDIKRLSFGDLEIKSTEDGVKVDYGAGSFVLEGIKIGALGSEDFVFG